MNRPAAASSNPAGPSAAQLEQVLRERLQAHVLQVWDESAQHAGHAGANGSGFGTHFRVRIASPLFTAQSRVARHRLVYDALHEFMSTGIHALALETID
ncbi:MAG: BolA family transcriptional regulator [Rhodoferax sp.]|nr:BolA family transcriptional regulator [Rhodoferax sp.]